MAVFTLTVNTTPDQDIALAALAVTQSGTPQSVLMGWIAELLGSAISQEVDIDIQKIRNEPLATLEAQAGQVPKS